MADHATPNLPARDLDNTAGFYGSLGFQVVYQDAGWLILSRGEAVLEFFPFADLDPATSSFGCCLRLDDVDAFYDGCRAAGIPEKAQGFPRLQPPRVEVSGMRVGYLLDPDGTLVRLVHNP